MFAQYKTLMIRVRRYARRCQWVGPWFRHVEFIVRPVSKSPILEASLRLHSPFRNASPLQRACVFSVVTSFAGCKQRAFPVKCESVARLGCGHSLRGSRSLLQTRVFRGDVGSFASVATNPFKGKVVRIVGAKTDVDEDSLLATLEADPFFTRPGIFAGIEESHAWHAVRIVHRTRLMRGRDATCERWGSLLHQLFDANPTKPHRYVARLFVRESGLGGDVSGAQDAVIEEITRFMFEELHKNPFCVRGSKRQRPHEAGKDLEEDAEDVRKGLRRHAMLELAAEVACPMQLRPDVAEKVQNASNTATNLNRGKIAALPRFMENSRTMHKNRTTSVLREAMQNWLSSDDARQWRAARERLFSTTEGS